MVFIIQLPALFPKGVRELSTPKVNSPIPVISIRAPIIKESISPVETGTKVKQISIIIKVIGSTELTDSLIFSIITVFFFKACSV